MTDCFICANHTDPAALVLDAGEHVVVTHLPLVTPIGAQKSVYLGYLFVEARRHVPELGGPGPGRGCVGRPRGGALEPRAQDVASAEHVYAAVIGHGIGHLHVHLIPRYPGTPREYWWTRVDEWPDAPRGDEAAIRALIHRLRAG